MSGVSVTVTDSKSILKQPTNELKHFYEPKPIRGEEVHRDWLPYVARYNINEDTLNDRFDYSIRKEEGVFRIITLGDSFTYGAYVNTQDNWTELLEDYLNSNELCDSVSKYEVINLGIWGYDIAYQTERFIKRGSKYNPDLILSLIVEFGRISEYVEEHSKEINLSAKQKKELEKKGIYYPELKLIAPEITTEYIINYQQKHIDRLISVYNKKILFLDFENNPLYKQTFDKLELDYSNILIEKIKLSFEEKEYFLPDGHLNNEGHKIIMNEVKDYLKKDRLIPCIN